MAPRARTLVVLAAVSLVAAGHAPDPNVGPLSYKTEAKRADLVVQEIAAQAGLTLESTDDAKRHVLVIAVTDVEPDALLERIALVTSSKWDVVGEKRTLVPDQDVRRKEQATKDAKRVEAFKKAQQQMRDELNKKPGVRPPVGIGEEEEMEEDYDVPPSPAEQALKQLAVLIDPNEVAKLGDDGRIVFSSSPNRMQRAMRNNQVTRILNDLVASHNAWAAEKIKEREAMKAATTDPETLAYMDMFGDESEAKLFETPPSKALLVLEIGSGFMSFMSGESPEVKLKVYDQKGAVIAQASETMGNSWYEDFATSEEEGEEAPPKVAQEKITEADRTLIQFSEKSKILSSLNPGESMNFNFPAPLLDLLSDPVTHDPLGFHHTDMVHAIAKAKNLDVVANLSDSDMEMFSMGMEERGVTVGQAYNAFKNEGGSTVTEADGWLTVAPADPIVARERRQDRVVLKAFITRVRQEGTASLDAISSFALSSPKPDFESGLVLYLLAFAPSTLQGLIGQTMDWDTLQLYASMLPNQKSSLRQGGRVPFGTLTTQARNILTRMSFSCRAGIKPAADLQKTGEQPFSWGLMGALFGGGASSLAEEPTEVMPNGLPPDGAIELKLVNEPIGTTEGSSGSFFLGMGALGADEFAMFEMMKEFAQASGEGLGEMGEMFTVPKTIKLGSREKLNFFFWLSPNAGMHKTLMDDTVPKNAPTVDTSNLPPAFRLLIDQRKKAIKESPYGRMLGGFGGIGG
ncbi:MAG: hypothetical protein WD716_00770 [Fimbriimonadaceae bacterium]